MNKIIDSIVLIDFTKGNRYLYVSLLDDNTLHLSIADYDLAALYNAQLEGNAINRLSDFIDRFRNKDDD